MGVYVDIDLDYLVKPVNKTGTNNVRAYRGDSCEVEGVHNFVQSLLSKGLFNCTDKKFFTNHFYF